MCATPGWVAAQTATPPPPAEPKPQSVEIRTTGDALRQASVASKVVVSREEIAKFGDTSLARVLSRVPGLVVTGSATQGLEVSLGGMTGGYTSILVNGERVPPGFSIDSIAPDTIERIEVIRAPTADMSNQAIAGTINIVLRPAPPRALNSTVLRASVVSGLGSAGVTQAWSTRDGAHAMGLTASLNADREALRSSVDVQARDASGALAKSYESQSTEQHKKLTLNLAPRWSFKPSEGGAWAAEAVLQAQQWDYQDQEAFTNRGAAQAPLLDRDTHSWDWRMLQARGSLAWSQQLNPDLKLEAKLNASHMQRRFDSLLEGYQSDILWLARTIGSNLQDTSLGLVGKGSLSLNDQHTLTAGLETQGSRRHEDRQHRETSTQGYPTLNFDEDHRADVVRHAVYAQDEWSISPTSSVYLGVRVESLDTATEGADFARVSNASLVASPVVQWRWNVLGRKSDTLRVSLGRTYKPPTARDLIPRRWIVVDNGPTAPHFQGNANLRPELAWGLDVSHEHHGADGFLLATRAYVRRIQDVVVQNLFQDSATQAWVISPVNAGTATSHGVEWEIKGRLLGAGNAAMPRVDGRLGYGLHRSKVDALASPGAVLAQQVPYSLSVGLDVIPAPKWQVGANYIRQGTRVVRLSDRQTMVNAPKESVDLYASYKQSSTLSWRLAVSQLGAKDAGRVTHYEGPEGSEQRALRVPQPVTIRLQLEGSF